MSIFDTTVISPSDAPSDVHHILTAMTILKDDEIPFLVRQGAGPFVCKLFIHEFERVL